MSTGLVALVVVGALVLSSAGGWPVVWGVLRLASRSSDAGQPETTGDQVDDPAGEPPDEGETPADEDDEPYVESDGPDGARAKAVLRGGTWIGVLERLAVTGCLLAGLPSGVAVVVAVKGLGRYPELRENPGASERFVIGTLASLLWSAGLGYLGTVLLAR